MQTNDWTLRRETVCQPVTLLDAVQEQSIELDYVLPDYCPDFFRLLHVTADPVITSRSLRDGVLTCNISVRIRVLYCAEDSRAVQAVTQQLDYAKQFRVPAGDFGSLAAEPCIRLNSSCGYINCRAVSPRRIDVRGAIRIAARITAEQKCEVLCGASGAHIQTRTEEMRYLAELHRTEKHCTVSGDIEIPQSQPALLTVLREQTDVRITETRIVAGKLMIRGEAEITLLYAADSGAETVRAVLPVSQIAEQGELRDGMPAAVTAVPAGLLLTPESDANADIRLLHCDLQLDLFCEAAAEGRAAFLTDAYSTTCACRLRREQVHMLTMPEELHESAQLQRVLTKPGTVLTKVWAAWCTPQEVTAEPAPEGGTLLSGRLQCCVMAADEQGAPLVIEQAEPFSWTLPELSPEQVLPSLTAGACTYTLTGPESVTVQAELVLEGQSAGLARVPLLTGIEPDDDADTQPGEDFALRLYFGQANEALWDIAKRCGTPVEAIRAENDLPGDLLTAPQMLLIPKVQ